MTSEPGSSPTRNCVSCGRAISWDANVCPYCGHDYRAAMAGPGAQKKETVMPIIGGILVLLCGLGYIFSGGFTAAVGGTFMLFDLGATLACGIIMLVIGIIVILGGIFAIQRKHFGIALVAGILAIPSILGIIGLILIIVAREEFK